MPCHLLLQLHKALSPIAILTHFMCNLYFSPGSQLSQSAYLPLQLPYSVFGLGQTPNFIDKLEVGIPRNSNVSIE